MNHRDSTAMLMTTLVLIFLVATAVSAFLLLDGNVENDDTVAIVLMIAVVATVGLWLISRFFVGVHDSMNSRLTELIEVTGSRERAEGREEGRQAQRQEGIGREDEAPM